MSSNNPKPAFSSIPVRVLLFMAWRNLVHKKLRAFLTIFGIVIGIGAIYFLLSFGIGLQRLVTNEVVGNTSIKSIQVTSSNAKVAKLDKDNFLQIKGLPHVATIGASYSYAGTIKARGGQVDSIVYGVDQSFQNMSHLSLSAGRKLSATDNKAVLVNNSVLRAIGIKTPKNAIGKTLSLRISLLSAGKPAIVNDYKIVGVINTDGGNEVYVPGGIFSAAGISVFTQINIEANNQTDVHTLRNQIETLGLQTASPVDTVDQINQVFKFFNIILVGFGAIGMIVAVLGMFNTITISLLERTKEIGLMVALGGRNSDIRKLFVYEALLLSLSGAVIGIFSATVLGQTVNIIMNIFASHRGVTKHFQLFAMPWWLILGTIVFMVVVGLLVVFIPARRASRIEPIDALRRE
jgi:putative ABC transport system permease protein